MSPRKPRLSDDERLKHLPELAHIRSRREKKAQNRILVGPNLQYVPSGKVLEKLAMLAAIARVPPKEGGH
jgi:hypothetical protein